MRESKPRDRYKNRKKVKPSFQNGPSYNSQPSRTGGDPEIYIVK